MRPDMEQAPAANEGQSSNQMSRLPAPAPTAELTTNVLYQPADAVQHQDEAFCTTRTSDTDAAEPTVNATAVPLAVTVIGAAALHRLTAAGYRVTGVCLCCGAPLVDPVSIARHLGPVCAARAERAA